MSQTDPKIIETALDALPYGKEGMAISGAEIRRPAVPEGVTERQLMKDALLIAWPALVELVLTQLTSMADQIMVGRMPGEAGIIGLSAVGLAIQPKFLLMTAMIALNVGCTAVVARFRGQQNRDGVNLTLRHAFYLNLILAAVFTVLGTIFAEPMIRIMAGNNISEETILQGTVYLRIQMYGFPFLMLSFTVTSALRGIGDSKKPMVYNTLANVINLFFNYMMIYGKFGCPAMGVAGASWATVIGQTAAFVIAMSIVLRPGGYMHLQIFGKFRFEGMILKNMVKIGVPSMLEQLFMRIGAIIFTRTVAGLGDLLYATHQILMSLMAFSFLPGQAFANSSTTLMGQSLGKRRPDMASLYMMKTRQLGMIASIVFGILLFVFRARIIGFYNTSPDVIAAGAPILILMAAMQPIQSTQFIVTGGLRGSGDTMFTAVVMFITMFGLRTILVLLFIKVLQFGLWGAWFAIAVDQTVRTVLVVWRYYTGKWILIWGDSMQHRQKEM